MFCSECGEKSYEGAKFCTECGAVIKSASAVADDAPSNDATDPAASTPPIDTFTAGLPPNGGAHRPMYTIPADAPFYAEPVQPVYTPPSENPAFGGVSQPMYTVSADTPDYAEPAQSAYMPHAGTPGFDEPNQSMYAPPAGHPPHEDRFSQMYQPPADIPSYGAAPPPIQYGGDKGKSKTWIPVIAVIIVLVLVLGALWRFTDILPWSYNGDSGQSLSNPRSNRDNDSGEDGDGIGEDDGYPSQAPPSQQSPPPETAAPASPEETAPEETMPHESTPEETAPHETAPTEDDPGDAALPLILELPSGGGEVRVNDTTEFEFTPEYSWVWVFTTSDNGRSDPILTLYDRSGYEIGYDDDSAGDYNARLVVFLDAGETYYISAGFYSGETGNYTLTVSHPSEIPENGGDIQVNGDSVYVFVPDQSGVWELRTSSDGNNDPEVFVQDSYRGFVGYDDDGAGGYDALLTVELDAGEIYTVYVNFYNENGFTTLTVTMR